MRESVAILLFEMSYELTTFGSLAGVKRRLSSPEIALAITKDTTVTDAAITATLADMKDTIFKSALLNFISYRLPDTITKWTAAMSANFNKYHKRLNLDTYPVFGMFTYSQIENFNDIWRLDATDTPSRPILQTQFPRTYFTTSEVSSGSGGTLAGTAEIGDRLVYSANGLDLLYINRKSAANPNWIIADSSDALDYITNPSVFAEAHEYLTIAQMFMLGMFRNRASVEDSLDFMDRGYKFYHDRWISTMHGEIDGQGRSRTAGVLQMLRVDFSNRGTLGDFEKKIFQRSPAFFS